MPRVIIVGGGAAGMAAARTLVNADVDIVLLEEGGVLGGNCFRVDVPGLDGTTVGIDAGVCDFNRSTFTELTSLVGDLDCELQPIGSTASFMSCDGISKCPFSVVLFSFVSFLNKPSRLLSCTIAHFHTSPHLNCNHLASPICFYCS